MDKNMTIEQANGRLEQIIAKLENEALPLQESVELYSEACALMAFCMERLNGYKGKIEEADKKLAKYISEGGTDHE